MRPNTRTVIVVVLALVAAGCSDDDATSTSGGTSPTATESTGSSAPGAAASTPTSSSATDSGPDVDGLLALYEMTPLRATYRFGAGDDQAEVVLAQDPTADPPIESITIAESRIIISEGVTIFCDGSNNMCFEVPGAAGENLAAGLLGPAGSLFLAAGGGDLTGIEVTEEPITVAGRDGVCFTFVPPTAAQGDTDLLRQCIDDGLGFTLLMQTRDSTSDELTTLMELIEFSQPTPEDFAPTGPVTPTP